jgi:cytochrome c551/c552
MFKCINTIVAITLAVSSNFVYADKYPNVGRTATEQEIAAWDIDVRPDFKGLPKGSGSVTKGQQIWEGRCASCHGTFGESNEVFTPIVGGTTQDDIKTGRVAALASNKQPQKTTLMKVATLSTLWDYIHRAMPWTAPKSLSNDEVFAVTAYILNLAEIIPDDFTLSDQNIAEVQKLMPNRNGMTLNHGMWDINGKPDVKSVACMKDCATQLQTRSSLPEVARNAHGNIQQQNRTFGAVRGVDTTRPALTTPVNSATRQELVALNTPSMGVEAEAILPAKPNVLSLAKQNACLACHGINNKIVGPGFNEIAVRYKSDPTAEARLLEKVKNGGSGSWGPTPMPAQRRIGDDDIKLLVNWILNGAK